MANLPITPSINPIYINQSVTFSTIPGYNSYTWSGSPQTITGNTYQSNAVTFTTEGLYDATVEVCEDEPGCCQTFTARFYVQASSSSCDFTTGGEVAGAPVSHTIPSGISTDVFIWFKIGGWPDKMIIRDAGDAVLLDTRFVAKTNRNDRIEDPDNSGDIPANGWYYPLILENISIGTTITSMAARTVYTDCSGSTPVSPSLSVTSYVAPNVKAKRSNNTGPQNLDVGIYIKIPQSVHGGNLMTVTCYPYQNYTCTPEYNNDNRAFFVVSCQHISEAGDNTWPE